MALKRITPGISDKSLLATVNRNYKDVDLNFASKPGTEFVDGKKRGDIYKKIDERAIEQSVLNILMTNNLEKPFQPLFGADLNSLLFGLSTQVSSSKFRKTIRREIERHEPRVKVIDVIIFDKSEEKEVPRGASTVFFYSSMDDGRYHLIVYVQCQIIATGRTIEIPVNMNRLR